MDDLEWLKQQRSDGDALVLPAHIAIIMDGNSRWAKSLELSALEGYNAGAQALRRTVEACYWLKIPYLTMYAFSIENWCRSAEEIAMLMNLVIVYLRRERETLKQYNIRLHIIGDMSLLPGVVRQEIKLTQEYLWNCQGMTLTLALSYSARDEITRGVRQIAREVASGKLQPEDIQIEHVQNSLGTSGIPDPDLLIRTSGEMRLSNFLLWQLAYTEFYFLQVMWPEFNARSLWEAMLDFSSRKRRFGGRSVASAPAQLSPSPHERVALVNASLES